MWKRFILLLLLLILPISGLAVEADVVDISTNYFDLVHAALNASTSSIHMVMYDVRVYDGKTNSPPYVLLNDLVDAHKRGVDLNVYLDRSRRFTGKVGETEAHTKNSTAKKVLIDAGIEVRHCYPSRLHAKLIVIDGYTVIDGSVNWSYWALTRNVESASMIRSPAYAAQKLKLFDNLAAKQSAKEARLPPFEAIQIPSWFVLDKKLAAKMLTDQSERTLDLYLLLVKQWQVNVIGLKEEMPFDYDTAAIALGMGDMDKTAYRRQITKTLRRLENDYGLINVHFKHAGPALVKMVFRKEAKSAISLKIPIGYWAYGWSRKLGLSAKFMYLVSVYKQREVSKDSYWSASQRSLAREFGVSKDTANVGMVELYYNDVISVRSKEAPIDEDGYKFSMRPPYDYRLRILRSEDVIEEGWGDLDKKYGKDVVKQARGLAALLHAENRQREVARLAAGIKKFSYDVMAQECSKLAKLRRDNPYRNVDYLMGIIGKGRK